MLWLSQRRTSTKMNSILPVNLTDNAEKKAGGWERWANRNIFTGWAGITLPFDAEVWGTDMIRVERCHPRLMHDLVDNGKPAGRLDLVLVPEGCDYSLMEKRTEFDNRIPEKLSVPVSMRVALIIIRHLPDFSTSSLTSFFSASPEYPNPRHSRMVFNFL
ncbi:hypothetical protein EYF80_042796 [Liparis tanakae]|uniref:Uncharacterized protein n=1 Tax=Liparis tanakae TaxID=230148 RepID=A0A4Z2G272_9TELE|nr:hypothetical protein EYF80_042796 [Liparis tanakae]